MILIIKRMKTIVISQNDYCFALKN